MTTQLALALSLANRSVGVLDVDLTGPNMPRFFGVESAKVTQAPGGWIPVSVHDASAADQMGSLRCMSLAFLLRDRGDAVVWRGPKKTAMVRQFLTDVLWADVDYLLIDTPPGTSDEHISLAESLLQHAIQQRGAEAGAGAGAGAAAAAGGGGEGSHAERLAGAVVVTTPQAVATADVRKELNFCAKTGIKVLGVIENMSGFVCPNCSECTNVFSSGGGELMARDFDLPFLGSVPLDPQFVRLVEAGDVPTYPAGTAARMNNNTNNDGVGGRTLPSPPDDVGGGGSDDATLSEHDPLVKKYQRCSLSPLFRDMAARLIESIESR